MRLVPYQRDNHAIEVEEEHEEVEAEFDKRFLRSRRSAGVQYFLDQRRSRAPDDINIPACGRLAS